MQGEMGGAGGESWRESSRYSGYISQGYIGGVYSVGKCPEKKVNKAFVDDLKALVAQHHDHRGDE